MAHYKVKVNFLKEMNRKIETYEKFSQFVSLGSTFISPNHLVAQSMKFSCAYQGVCKQRVVHQNTFTRRSSGHGKTRFRTSELGANSEAFEQHLRRLWQSTGLKKFDFRDSLCRAS